MAGHGGPHVEALAVGPDRRSRLSGRRGHYFRVTEDQAIMMPMLEMSGTGAGEAHRGRADGLQPFVAARVSD